MYNSVMNNINVFTPLTEDRSKRLRFNRDSVQVIKGTLGNRELGYKATVEIYGTLYKVYGTECDLPNCNCDAYVVRV